MGVKTETEEEEAPEMEDGASPGGAGTGTGAEEEEEAEEGAGEEEEEEEGAEEGAEEEGAGAENGFTFSESLDESTSLEYFDFSVGTLISNGNPVTLQYKCSKMPIPKVAHNLSNTFSSHGMT